MLIQLITFNNVKTPIQLYKVAYLHQYYRSQYFKIFLSLSFLLLLSHHERVGIIVSTIIKVKSV